MNKLTQLNKTHNIIDNELIKTLEKNGIFIKFYDRKGYPVKSELLIDAMKEYIINKRDEKMSQLGL